MTRFCRPCSCWLACSELRLTLRTPRHCALAQRECKVKLVHGRAAVSGWAGRAFWPIWQTIQHIAWSHQALKQHKWIGRAEASEPHLLIVNKGRGQGEGWLSSVNT